MFPSIRARVTLRILVGALYRTPGQLRNNERHAERRGDDHRGDSGRETAPSGQQGGERPVPRPAAESQAARRRRRRQLATCIDGGRRETLATRVT